MVHCSGLMDRFWVDNEIEKWTDRDNWTKIGILKVGGRHNWWIPIPMDWYGMNECGFDHNSSLLKNMISVTMKLIGYVSVE